MSEGDDFLKVCKADSIRVSAQDRRGAVNYICDWKDGSRLEIRRLNHTINFGALESHSHGLYARLCATLPQWARDRDIKTFTCEPATLEARTALLGEGEWEDNGDGTLIWRL